MSEPEDDRPEWEKEGMSYDEWVEAQLAKETRKAPKIPRKLATAMIIMALTLGSGLGIKKGWEILSSMGQAAQPGLVPTPTEEPGAMPSQKVSAVLTPTQTETGRAPEILRPPRGVEDRYMVQLRDPDLWRRAEKYLTEKGREGLYMLGQNITWEKPVPMHSFKKGEDGWLMNEDGWAGDKVVAKGIYPYKLYQVILPDGREVAYNYFMVDEQGVPRFNTTEFGPGEVRSWYEWNDEIARRRGVPVFGRIEGEEKLRAAGSYIVKKIGEGLDSQGREQLDLEFTVPVALLDHDIKAAGLHQVIWPQEESKPSPVPLAEYPEAGKGR